MDQTPGSATPLGVIDGKYQLVRKLGEGGMGAVYEGRHKGTGRRCAVKVIAGEALGKSADIVDRFQREAMASGRIESQYIAQVMDTGVDPVSGAPYIVMELLVGEDVEQAVHRLGPLSPELALRVAAQACLGLQKAHDAEVVHRDIKPANIFLTRRDGGEVVAKLLDFGIAKVRADPLSSPESKSLTRTGSMLGSPLYMSPEQALGQKTIDHRTDVWSLGVVLYEALAGKTPHGEADTLGVLIMKICSEPPAPVQALAPWVPPEVAAIVHRALALDPAARWSSAGEMYAAIRALLPNGHALDESMFVPMSDAAKEVRAGRFSLPDAVQVPMAATMPSRLSRPDASEVRASTMAGMTGSVSDEETAALPKKRNMAPVAAFAIAAVLAIGGVVAFLMKPAAPPPAAAGLVAAAAPPTVAPPTSASPAEKTARLVILPPDAEVTVDGVPAAIADGTVAITGALGSQHHVLVVASGDRAKRVEVVIAQDGVVPPVVELGPAPAAAPKVAAASGASPKHAEESKPAKPEEKKGSLHMDIQ